MWLLRPNSSLNRFELDHGIKFAPSHYSYEQFERLVCMVSRLAKGVDRTILLSWRAFENWQKAGGKVPHGTLVALHGAVSKDLDEGPLSESLATQAAESGADWVIIHDQRIRGSRAAWLERTLKPWVERALSEDLSGDEDSGRQPLASISIGAMPVRHAAMLTSDPLELIDLVERTIAHRLESPIDEPLRHGEREWTDSLLYIAGELVALRVNSIGSDELREAAADLLIGTPSDTNRSGQELARLGLADYRQGHLSLGPMARALRECDGMLGAFRRRVNLQGAAAARLRGMPNTQELQPSLQSPTWSESITVSAIPALRAEVQRSSLEHAPEALDLIEAIQREAAWVPLPEPLRRQRASVLRSLRAATPNGALAPLLRCVEALVAGFGARGDGIVAEREEALRILTRVESRATQLVRADLRFLLAVTVTRSASGDESRSYATELARLAWATWKDLSENSAAANAGILLGYLNERGDQSSGVATEAVKGWALQANPDDALALGQYAGLLAQLGQQAEAEKRFRRALEIDSKNGAILGRYGAFLESMKRLDEAEEMYLRAIEVDSSIDYNFGNYAALLHRKGQLDRAEETYRRAIEVNPRNVRSLGNFAILLHGQGRLEEAGEAYRRAIELNPKLGISLANYALLLDASGLPEKANEMHVRAIAAEPENAHFLGNYALSLIRQGRMEEADATFRLAMQVDPQNEDNLGNYLVFLKKRGRLEEASALGQRTIVTILDSPPLLLRYSGILEMQGRLAESETMHRRAIEIAPNRFDIPGNFALFLQRRGRMDEAAEMFNRATNADPSDANNLANFAGFRFLRGEDAAARELMHRARAVGAIPATLDCELVFYEFAFMPEMREAARAELRRLIEETVRSPDWDFDIYAAKAIELGHPEPELLRALSQVLSGKTAADILSLFW